MLFDRLARTSEAVGATTKRSEKIRLLAEAIEAMEPDEIAEGVTFLSGHPRQDALGVGYATLARTPPDPSPTSHLTVLDVHAAFDHIAAIAGEGSTDARYRAVEELLARATAIGQKMLLGLMGGELRQGAQRGMVQEAIARAFDVPSRLVRRAVMLSGDLGTAAAVARDGGVAALEDIRLQVGRPIQPMLASVGRSTDEAIGRVGPASVEVKLDGARIQVHRDGDQVRVFTRNLRDVTHRLPQVVEAVLSLDVGSIVLDGEAISFDRAGMPMAFQDTAGAFGTEVGEPTIELQPFFFDLLALDARDVLDEPLQVRWDELVQAVPEPLRVRRIVTEDAGRVRAFFEEVVATGHEGVVVKSLAAPYQAGRRGTSWIKVKPVHTLDLVVLAAEWGHGRRTGRLSNLHLGARDPSSGEFVMLGKTFKGLTDEMLAWQTDRLTELRTHETRRTVHVRPELVVEIAFDGVQRSSRYPGGVALRFARVTRYRDDKPATEADTIDTVRSFLRALS